LRIALVTWTSRLVGGAETYVSRTLSAFVGAGHHLALCYESDEPDDRPRFKVPASVTTFCVSDDGSAAALDRLREWHPDVVYVHGLSDPAFEAAVQSIAPAVLFAHAYYGTCISGDKAHRLPVISPCSRTFGPACLALYYPRRCGGLNPVTFAREYARQRRRLELLAGYAAVLTHSEHMRREYLRHGAAGGRVVNCSISAGDGELHAELRDVRVPVARGDAAWFAGHVPHLVFAGRMDPLKGGAELLRAAAIAHERLDSPLRITLAGDGMERVRWEQVACEVAARHDRLSIHFTGWLGPAGVARLLATADILVMPSLWPEPFGLIGQEANRHGVPVVAYGTGAIPEWLVDGVNGCLAPGDPPTVHGLADALVRSLADRTRHRAMRRAAVVAGHSRPDDLHIAAVLDVLQEVAGRQRPAAVAIAR
jgi:glycosyltransferase involved in cell wall biosynthesis